MRQRTILRVAIVVLACLAATGCGIGRSGRGKARISMDPLVLGAQAECVPQFPDQGGWLGGDSAASAVLPGGDGRASVWLFGDSFVEGPGSPAGRAYPFVHNSIAVSHCDARGNWRLTFAWARKAEGEPRAFFEPDPEAAWVAQIRREAGKAPYYWPISAVSIRGSLFVALLRVAPAAASGPFRLPFRLVGVDLARIENPEHPPAHWRIRYSTLSDRDDVFPAASLVVENGYLHAFAFLDRGDGRAPRVLTRLPIDALTVWQPDLESSVETLVGDGRWTAGLEPARARVLMEDDASEMSVHFDPGLGVWLAVYADPTAESADEVADTVWLRRAPHLSGPWTPRTALLAIPELAPERDPEPGEPFCYAAKAHPELAPSGELLVTWVCNFFAESDDEATAVLERLRTTSSFYRPRAVRLAVPPAVDPSIDAAR